MRCSRWWRGLLGWQLGLVVSVVPNINEVTLHRARITLAWAAVFGQDTPSRHVTSQLGQLGLASLQGY